MLSLSLKKRRVFEREFSNIFPNSDFDTLNILEYIAICSKLVLEEAKKYYKENIIYYINPVFIYGKGDNLKVYKAPNMSDKLNIIKSNNIAFNLVDKKVILPLSVKIVNNNLHGICLIYDNDKKYDYELYHIFNLKDIKNNIKLIDGEIHEDYVISEIQKPLSNLHLKNESLQNFAQELSITAQDELIKLKKALILYKFISKSIGDKVTFSFINKFNPHNFFECLFTVISENQFSEDQLLDFASIVESISSPLAKYFDNNENIIIN